MDIKKININFVDKIKYALIVSSLIIVSGLISLIYKGGPSLGIDFAGGRKIQLTVAEKFEDTNGNDTWDTNEKLYDINGNGKYDPGTLENTINTTKLKTAFSNQNIDNIETQIVGKNSKGEEGHTIAITLPLCENLESCSDDKIYRKVIDKTLNDNIPNNNIELREFIGPKVGAELKSNALTALGIALLLITLLFTAFDKAELYNLSDSLAVSRFFAFKSLLNLLYRDFIWLNKILLILVFLIVCLDLFSADL